MLQTMPLARSRSTVVAGLVSIVVALSLAACDRSVGTPPIEVEFRDSLVDLGQIAQLTNTSTRPLTNVKVRVENPNNDVKHTVIEAIAPGQTVEVGWKKLEGLRIKPGARLTLRCDEYLLPKIVKLAAGPERSGALVDQGDE